MFLDFASTWPSDMPGLHPMFSVFILFIMAGFGVLMLGGIIVGYFRESSEVRPDRHITKIIEPMLESTGDWMSSGRKGKYTGYDIPPFCDNCGVKLDIGEVEWIGPVSFKCPRCHEEHRARKIHV